MPLGLDNEAVRAAFLLGHVVLGILVFQFKFLAPLHAGVVLLLGVICASRTAATPWTIGILAYLVGSEVLWRMTESLPSWEFGKYAFALVCGVAVIRRRSHGGNALLALLYFALLIPGAWVAMSQLSLGDARREISFNLSGPLALAMGIMYFSGVRLTLAGIQRAMLALAAPVVAILAAASFRMFSLERLNFRSESAHDASGGFGPNQVSVLLGLGATALVIYLLTARETWRSRLLVGAIAAAMLTQGLLTFARAGILGALLSLTLVGLFLARSRNHRVALGAFLVGGILFVQFVIPAVNQFTDGMLQVRYEEVTESRRSDIIQADWMAWQENPILGTGVGLSKDIRESVYGARIASHTEFSRLPAEHGIFGLVALGLLTILIVQSLRRAPAGPLRAISVGLVCSGVIYMATNGMRLAVPALLLGLVSSHLMAGQAPPPAPPAAGHRYAPPPRRLRESQ